MRTLARNFSLTLLTLFTLLWLLPAASADVPVEDHYFTTSDGLKLHYARLGDSGSTVILIHGSGGMARTCLEIGIAQRLAENHVVIVPNMRGHGMSEGPRDGDMPLDVIELMDQLNIERAHIHGFSMGGAITARLMARIPERIITAAFDDSGVRETEDWAIALLPPETEGGDPRYEEVQALFRSRQSDAHLTYYPGFIIDRYLMGLVNFINIHDE